MTAPNDHQQGSIPPTEPEDLEVPRLVLTSGGPHPPTTGQAMSGQPAELADLAAEAEANDPLGTSMRFANATAEERQRTLALAAEERAERKASHDRLRDAMLPADWDEYLRTAPPEVQAIYGYDPLTAATHWRTLADVPDDPPRPLLFGMLEPDGPTLAYAAPGVGKGTSGAWLVCEALRAGMLPVIYDAERRPREWARRVAGLGGDRSRVVYIEPVDLGPELAGRPFWETAPAVRQIITAAGADLFVLDSLLPASGVGEERLRSDAQSPFLFVAALDSLRVPSLSFGHPPKGQPEGDPFGSMAWLAAYRLTWLGTKAEGEGHRVRWRPRKRNERGHIAGVLLTISYGEDGRPCAVTREDDEESTRDWILGALAHGPRAVADLADDLVGELDDPAAGDLDRAKERLNKALRRMAREGWVSKEGTTGRGVRWSLRLADHRP